MPSESRWVNLNGGEDVFEHIVRTTQLVGGTAALSNLRLVCKRWKALVDASILELSPTARLVEDPAILSLLASFRNLTNLNATDKLRQLGNDSCELLAGFTRLRSLSVTGSVGVLGLSALQPLAASLESLEYHGPGTRTGGLSDAGAELLAPFTALRSLAISRCSNLSNVGIVALSTLTKLSSLRIYDCGKLGDFGIAGVLPPLIGLTSLVWAFCDLGDAGLEPVGKLPRLSVLDVSNNNGIGDAGVIALAPLAHTLTQLKITNAALFTGTAFPALPHLVALEMATTDVSDEGLAALVGQAPALQRLSVADCLGVSAQGLAALKALTDLRSLNVSSCMNVDDLHALRQLTGLTSLKLAYIEELEDEALASLAPLSGLRHLTLEGTAFSEEARLDMVKGLQQLTYLHFGTVGATSIMRKVLREVLPALVELEAAYPDDGPMFLASDSEDEA